MSLEELEARVAVLEAVEAIKILKAKYAYLTDVKDMKAFGDLFTDDAVMDFGPWGRYEGRSECVRFVRDIILGQFSFMMHMNHNPIIKVEGDTATGEWYFEVPVTHEPTSKALWITGKYEEEYVKVAGEWKFKTIVGKVLYYTPYDEGWVETIDYDRGLGPFRWVS